ncbi:MAG TPA: CsbD family protein [Anaerolineales bacterium]|nr:CsbD family protein [Anaerolineales bacterium]
MNKDILTGNWKQIRGSLKEWWGLLTDDELDQIEGRRERLVGKIQEKYGYTRQEAEESVQDFLDRFEAEMEKRFTR